MFLVSIYLVSCSNPDETSEKKITKTEEFAPEIPFSLVTKLPHDSSAFTEGLLFHDGLLFESTGSPANLPETRSFFGVVDLNSGKINVKAELDKMYFGEGIVILKDKLYQLTYQNNIGFIYDTKSFKQIDRFSFDNKEGWGLTTDGTDIIMSDGTNILTYLDPISLKPKKTLAVNNGGYAEDNLNELEYINGFIYANVWTKNYIVKIDPVSGKVAGIIDLVTLLDDARKNYPASEVLNGIAFDPTSDKIYVTGKLWKHIYQIDFPH